MGGVKAVLFDGKRDAYRGPVTVAGIEGGAPRTIAVWAWNPAVDSPEETIVSWGRRGGPDGSMLGLNWGSSGAYGGAKADALEGYMKQRETHWVGPRYPFQST